MSRTTLEKITASLVVVLITTLSLGFILMIANVVFEWDIFPPTLEKILYFLGFSMLVVALASTLVNIILNISRLTYFAQIIAEHILRKDDK